jgi:hypothetical protein
MSLPDILTYNEEYGMQVSDQLSYQFNNFVSANIVPHIADLSQNNTSNEMELD